jgi:hypothetical protein
VADPQAPLWELAAPVPVVVGPALLRQLERAVRPLEAVPRERLSEPGDHPLVAVVQDQAQRLVLAERQRVEARPELQSALVGLQPVVKQDRALRLELVALPQAGEIPAQPSVLAGLRPVVAIPEQAHLTQIQMRVVRSAVKTEPTKCISEMNNVATLGN